MEMHGCKELLMSETGIRGIDLFKIAGESISGWIPSWKMGGQKPTRHPFCSLMEERLLLYLEYHPQVVWYGRGDISPTFASTYNITTPLTTPFVINYLFDGNAHVYLPDAIGQFQDGSLLIAEAGMEQEKLRARNQAKAEAARKVALAQGGVYWIGTEATLLPKRHANLVFLHARRQPFPSFPELAEALQVVWSWGEAACVQQVVERLGERWSPVEKEAAVWKRCADAAACGHLLVDLATVQLTRLAPLICLPPDSPPILPDPLPSHLESSPHQEDSRSSEARFSEEHDEKPTDLLSTFDDSVLDEKQRERFLRNLRAVEAVRNGATLREAAAAAGMGRSTLGRLVQRTVEFGQVACVPRATYHRERELHPAFQQTIRLLYSRPTNLSIQGITEHVELKQVAARLRQDTGMAFALPSYDQVRRYIQTLQQEPKVRKERGEERGVRRERQSSLSFALSIPAPAQLAQVDEHSMELYVVTKDGIPVASRMNAAVLVCVKTAAIMSAVIALGPLAEEDYMRLVKGMLEPKDRLVLKAGCQHDWPCYGKPATIFHDRGKIFTSERARQVLVDRLGIITEQAPPYCPSAKGTVEALFTWMTRKFEHRLPGTTKATPKDRGVYDSVHEAEQAGLTFDVLEKLFIQAIVDGYMQEWDKLRRQTRIALWEDAVQAKGIPRWMGSQDDLKLLLMKAVNRKNRSTGRYAVKHDSLSFLGRRYVSPGLLNRLRGREIDIYYDRRDISVIYLFLNGELVGEAFCAELMGKRLSIWEADAQRRADVTQAEKASAESLENRQRIQEEALSGRKLLSLETKRLEQARQFDQQRLEIHPSSVQATLQALKGQPIPSPPSSSHSGLLPPAVPEDDPPGTEIQRLVVRKWRREDE
jgi:transposase